MKRMHIEKGVHGNKRERAKDNKKGIQQCAVATADLYNTSTIGCGTFGTCTAPHHGILYLLLFKLLILAFTYIHIPNIHLGLRFEFGPQRLGI